MLQLLGTHVPETSTADNLSLQVIAEARNQLGLDDDDDRQDAIDKIRSYLSAEATRILLGSQDQQEILNRLGEAGKLPTGIFEIKASDEFKQEREHLRFAKDCIVSSDEVLHLNDPSPKEQGKLSLFSKRIASKTGVTTQYCLVTTARYGRSLHVRKLWRLAPTFLAGEPTPINIFRSFVAHYGLPIILSGHRSVENLIWDEVINATDLTFDVDRISGTRTVKSEVLFMPTMGGFQIRYACAIDYEKYEKDRKRLAKLTG